MAERAELKGRYVLVTGASGGIGSQIVRSMLDAGAHVGAHYRSDRESAERLGARSGRGRFKTFPADFARPREVERLWSEFMRWSGGRIDVLVNNAASVVAPLHYEELSDAVWDQTFQVNVKAPFALCRAALSVMKKKRYGRMINLSSIGIKFGGSPTTLHYSASKAALEAVTRSIAKLAAPHNVLVNIVRVGVTDTKLHEKAGKARMAQRIALIPLKRAAQPREISDVVLFLAGSRSSFIANTTIEVSGGE